jgi:malonyl-CoA reductase / 3-hydroxypropionate dehydrogenase (NADP+)
VQINAIAPGPVDGDRLRGTGERPGLFSRRARLILENKRLNEIHAALVEAQRAGARIPALLPALLANNVAALRTVQVPALQSLAAVIADQNVNGGLAGRFLMNEAICHKLVRRLRLGGELPDSGEALPPFNAPPADEPFFAPELIRREAGRVRDGVLGMLYLRRMPTEFDVAMATVYYLADRNVSGETFHPSGGLKLDRTVTEGELFGKGSRERIAQLAGRTVFLVGEHLHTHLLRLSRAFLDDCGVARVVFVTESEATGQTLLHALGDHAATGRAVCIAAGDDIEGALKQARARYGLPGPVVSTPFRPLPTCRLSADASSDWGDVLSAAGFADVVEHNLTHHFRVARTVSLMHGAQLVLVTPETSARSSAEEFALANFIKTSLHALTATLGAESERTAHHVPVNQVDLTRRSRSEEPRGAGEEAEELERFVSAVLLTSAPIPAPHESRYRARIYRGNAITV